MCYAIIVSLALYYLNNISINLTLMTVYIIVLIVFLLRLRQFRMGEVFRILTAYITNEPELSEQLKVKTKVK